MAKQLVKNNTWKVLWLSFKSEQTKGGRATAKQMARIQHVFESAMDPARARLGNGQMFDLPESGAGTPEWKWNTRDTFEFNPEDAAVLSKRFDKVMDGEGFDPALSDGVVGAEDVLGLWVSGASAPIDVTVNGDEG